MQPMDAAKGVGAEEALSLLPGTSGVMSRCAEDSRKLAAFIDRAIKVSSWSQTTELVALIYQVHLAWKCHFSLDNHSPDLFFDPIFVSLIITIVQSGSIMFLLAIDRRKFKRDLLTLSAVVTTTNVDTYLELEKSAESTPPAEPNSVFDDEGMQRIAEKDVRLLGLACATVFLGAINKLLVVFGCVYFPGPLRDCLSWPNVVFLFQDPVACVQLLRCRRQLKTFLSSLQRRLEA